MDKKILLGGAAALIMAGSMVATPASANISLELSGEAQVTILSLIHISEPTRPY